MIKTRTKDTITSYATVGKLIKNSKKLSNEDAFHLCQIINDNTSSDSEKAKANEEIICAVISVILRKMKRYNPHNIDFDDMLMFLIRICMLATKHYDPKISTIRTFMETVVSNRIKTYYTYYNNTEQRVLNRATSLDQKVYDDEDSNQTTLYSILPCDYDIYEEIFKEEFKLPEYIRNSISPIKLKTLLRLYEGKTMEEIALEDGVSTKLVDNRLFGARVMLRRKMKEEEWRNPFKT